MTMHLNDEQFTSYLLGAPDADVREHLERCADCRAEAHLLSETVLDVAAALRSEASRAQTRALERSALRTLEAERRRIPKGPSLWTLAPVLATIVVAAVLFFTSSIDTVDRLWQGPRSASANQSLQSPVAEGSAQQASQSQSAAAKQSSSPQDDDALLRSIQEDASREVPAALEPAVVIVDERDRIAELRSASSSSR
jgi:hypothetical protein